MEIAYGLFNTKPPPIYIHIYIVPKAETNLHRKTKLFRIVTGVLLTKQNGIIHLAIAERTLLPYGEAEVASSTFYEPWKSTYDFFNIDDFDIHENVDYFALTYENRSINLDMVTKRILPNTEQQQC